jgi:hypothetical protein
MIIVGYSSLSLVGRRCILSKGTDETVVSGRFAEDDGFDVDVEVVVEVGVEVGSRSTSDLGYHLRKTTIQSKNKIL